MWWERLILAAFGLVFGGLGAFFAFRADIAADILRQRSREFRMMGAAFVVLAALGILPG